MKTILFDFDGVIHNHSTNDWKGIDIIEGQPVEGIKDCIKNLRKTYKIVVYSSRCIETRGIEAIRAWLESQGIEVDGITKDKLSYASMIVDDRAINFNGDCKKLIGDIENFKIWTNK